MRSLEARIVDLRAETEDKYLAGDYAGALKASLRLDKLIALAQREQAVETQMLQERAQQEKARKPAGYLA